MPSLKLRQDTVRKLPYAGAGGKHQCIYWDADFESFGVRVYPSLRRTDVGSYRVQRRKRLATLGRVDVLTLDQAVKKAKAFLGKAASNEDPQDAMDQLRASLTVKQLVAAYVEQHAKPKKRSWQQDQSCLQRLLIPAFGSRLAVTVTAADIQQIHAAKGATHPYAANNFLEVVRKMFNWARTPAGLVPKFHDNPATGIVMFPERKRKRFITTVEMPRFVEALEQELREAESRIAELDDASLARLRNEGARDLEAAVTRHAATLNVSAAARINFFMLGYVYDFNSDKFGLSGREKQG